MGVHPVETTCGVLGGTALLINGRLREDWGRPRERAVLATLLVHPGRWVSIDTLIEWAWSEGEPPRNPVQTFHNYATRIRKWLQPLPSPPTLRAGNGAYRLEVDRSRIDYHQFRALIAEAREQARDHNPKSALELAQLALGLWRGQPLEGLSSEPALAWRRRVIQNEWIPAQVALLQALVDIENFDDALVRLDDLQASHPNDLSLATLRLSVLHGLARHSDGYAYYVETRRRLLDEHADEQAADHLRRHHESLMSRKGPPAYRPPAPDTPPRQIPHDIVDFVGRTDLLAALDFATAMPLDEWVGSIVVLDGMAGVGKTALAVRWAHRARRRFPDGQLYANLNGFAASPRVEPAAVVEDFLIALGHPPDAQMSKRSKEILLSSLLANKRMLVLLDNARDSAHVRELVPLFSNCVVIVTSRQWLSALSAATGARRVRVDPMADAEVADLIYRCLHPRCRIDRDHLTQIVPLCSGLPLAAIFLADHVATRPDAELSQFASHLDRQQLIAEIGGHGDGSADLSTFFGWSYQELASSERRLFRLLGLHPGPDLSVEVACACDGRTRAETVRSLGVLVCAHLIEQPEAFDRYRFHDLLREFAADRAEADETSSERQAAMLRYMSFYLSSATNACCLLHPSHLSAPELPSAEGVEPVVFTDLDAARRWFDLERRNLVTAMNSAFELGYYQHVWRLADVTSIDRIGFYADSQRVRELAVLAAREIGDREVEMSALVSLGMANIDSGHYVEARRCLDAVLRMAEEDGHGRAQCTALYHLSRLEMLQGKAEVALDLLQRALDIARRSEDHAALCWNHCRLGEVFRAVGNLDRALFHFHQSQWFAQLIGDDSAHAFSLIGIGLIYRGRDDLKTALAYCERALNLAEPISDFAAIAEVCIALAEINITGGDIYSALGHAGRAVSACRQTHDLTNEARAHDVLGDAHLELGDVQPATEEWRHAATLYTDLGNAVQLSRINDKLTGC
jgi:tetratricopeptide (TPR) repeat protein/DNA-binding SARP family transcriptional activator